MPLQEPCVPWIGTLDSPERAEKILKSFSVTCSEKNLENSLGICSDSSAFSHGLIVIDHAEKPL